jgi:hypothetical protein
MSDLACELASCLEPVRAPESLWYRVEAGLFPGPSPPRSMLRPALCLLLAIMVCATAWSVGRRTRSLATAALQLHRENRTAASRPPNTVETLGARRLPGGRSAVFYRVDGYPVTLLSVPSAQAPSKMTKRIDSRPEPAEQATVFTWEAHGHAYALVSSVPENSRRACIICHG